MDITREQMGRGSAPEQEPAGRTALAPAEEHATASDAAARVEGPADASEPGAAQEVAPDAERLHLLLVRLGRELFAIDLPAVEEAVEVAAVERVPDMPEAMLGVCDVRGSLIAVYSPARALRAARARPRAEEGVVLLMRVGARRVGLAVDDVEDVLALEAASLRHPTLPGTTDGVVLGIARVGRELATVIDAAALLAACGAAPPAERTPAVAATAAAHSEAA